MSSKIILSGLLLAFVVANAEQLAVSPFTSTANITEQELQHINQTFAKRLGTNTDWQIQPATEGQSGPCDYDCTLKTLLNSTAQYAIYGRIENSTQIGENKITAVLINKNGEQLQQESILVGPNIEQDLGKVSALANMFETASDMLQQNTAEEPAPTKASQAANWVLGIGALTVLAVVLYSLL